MYETGALVQTTGYGQQGDGGIFSVPVVGAPKYSGMGMVIRYGWGHAGGFSFSDKTRGTGEKLKSLTAISITTKNALSVEPPF